MHGSTGGADVATGSEPAASGPSVREDGHRTVRPVRRVRRVQLTDLLRRSTCTPSPCGGRSRRHRGSRTTVLALESAIWHEAALFHHAGLANFCGPYTRSYGPDATRTVTLIALWIWAAFGRARRPAARHRGRRDRPRPRPHGRPRDRSPGPGSGRGSRPGQLRAASTARRADPPRVAERPARSPRSCSTT